MSQASELDTEGLIRAWAAERRLPDSHLKRWLAMLERDRKAILDLACTLRLRTGEMVVILDLIADLTVSKRQSAGALLESDGPRRAIKGNGSARSRAVVLIQTLRSLRYPHMTAAAERIAVEIRALKLPPELTVTAPKNLASDEVTIQIRLSRREQIDTVIDALVREKSGVARILAFLHGED